MKTFRYTPFGVEHLTSTDLRSEADGLFGATAYRIYIFNNDQPEPEAAEALYANGRLGIAWGADATWADVKDVESGIEMWLNDGEAWEAAN